MQSAPGNGRTSATSSGELKPYFDLHFAETAFTRWVQSVGNRYRYRPPQAEESFDIDSTLRVLRRIERLSAISLQKRMRFGSKQVELRVNPVLAELRTAIEQSFKGIKVEPAILRHLLRTVLQAQQSQFLSEGLSAVTSIGGLSVGTKLSSAVLISPTILLTNRHVLPSVKKASEATVSFDRSRLEIQTRP